MKYGLTKRKEVLLTWIVVLVVGLLIVLIPRYFSKSELDRANFESKLELYGIVIKDGRAYSRDYSENLKEIVGLKPDKIKLFDGGYIADDQAVYFLADDGFKKLENSNPSTFIVIAQCRRIEVYPEYFAKDRNNVYIGGNIFEGVSPKNFKIIASFDIPDSMDELSTYSTDGKNVWYGCGKQLNDADPDTFKYVGETYAKDKNHVWGGAGYSFGLIKDVEPRYCTTNNLVGCRQVK